MILMMTMIKRERRRRRRLEQEKILPREYIVEVERESVSVIELSTKS
jgi:hypothetical protein